MVVILILIAMLSISINLFNGYLSREIKEFSGNLKIIVNIKSDVNASSVSSLQTQINGMYGVKSTQYKSKEDIIRDLSAELGTEFNYLDNPFYDQIIVIINPGIDANDLVNTINSSDSVQGCDFDSGYLSSVEHSIQVMKRVLQFSFWLGNITLLFIASVATCYYFERELRASEEKKREVIVKALLFWIVNAVVGFILIVIFSKYILAGKTVQTSDLFEPMNILKESGVYLTITIIVSLISLGSLKGEE